jgi:hypothetical protein
MWIKQIAAYGMNSECTSSCIYCQDQMICRCSEQADRAISRVDSEIPLVLDMIAALNDKVLVNHRTKPHPKDLFASTMNLEWADKMTETSYMT